MTAAEIATTKTQPSPVTQVRDMAPEFAMALGGKQLAERFVRVALTAMSRNPDLKECTRETLLGGLMTCAQLRLEPNDPRGLAYLIPFKNNKERTTEAQLVIGYKGLVDLAHRSAQIKTLAAEVVHENDHFVAQEWPRHLEHKSTDGDRGKVVRYYAAVEYKDGGTDFAVMTVAEIENHRDLYAKGATRSDSPWRTNFDSMARKTVLRKLTKMMPMSVEDMRPFAAALHVDGMATQYQPGRSLDDLLTLEQPAAEPEAPRVTFTEITTGRVDDVCPACGVTPAHAPGDCAEAATDQGDDTIFGDDSAHDDAGPSL